MVDYRDFLILSQLRKYPFSSYETLGRGIGLSGKAVKTRIEAIQEAGILTSLQAVPAAQVFRRAPRLFSFKHPAASPETLDAAIEIDPAVFATLDANRTVVVLIHAPSPSPGAPAPRRNSRTFSALSILRPPRFFHFRGGKSPNLSLSPS